MIWYWYRGVDNFLENHRTHCILSWYQLYTSKLNTTTVLSNTGDDNLNNLVLSNPSPHPAPFPPWMCQESPQYIICPVLCSGDDGVVCHTAHLNCARLMTRDKLQMSGLKSGRVCCRNTRHSAPPSSQISLLLLLYTGLPRRDTIVLRQNNTTTSFSSDRDSGICKLPVPSHW